MVVAVCVLPVPDRNQGWSGRAGKADSERTITFCDYGRHTTSLARARQDPTRVSAHKTGPGRIPANPGPVLTTLPALINRTWGTRRGSVDSDSHAGRGRRLARDQKSNRRPRLVGRPGSAGRAMLPGPSTQPATADANQAAAGGLWPPYQTPRMWGPVGAPGPGTGCGSRTAPRGPSPRTA